MSKEIDALVAEHVMGWDTRMQPEGCQVHIPGVRGFDAGPWSPCTDWRAAGEVVQKMAEEWDVEISRLHNMPRVEDPTDWLCKIGELTNHDPCWFARATSFPMAVALCALRAKGVEVPK